MPYNEKLTIFEISNMYGEFRVLMAKMFLSDGVIQSLIYYRAFADLFLWFKSSQVDRTEYERLLELYNLDCQSRFKKSIEFIHSLQLSPNLGFIHAISGWSDFKISNIYDRYYKKYKTGSIIFKNESDLEYIIYDSLDFFDLDRVKVAKQHALKSGSIDLVINFDEHIFLIELKKGKAKRKDIYQILDYGKQYSLNQEDKSSLILIAHEFDDDVVKLAAENNVSCYNYLVGPMMPHACIYLEQYYGGINDPKFDELYSLLLDCDGIVARLDGMESGLSEKWEKVKSLINITFENIRMA